MKINKPLIIGTLLSSFVLSPAMGSEIDTLITMLHENGIVSDEQFVRLQLELSQNKLAARSEKQQMQRDIAQARQADDVSVEVKGGITVNSRDGSFSTKIGGRVQADAAVYNGSPEMGDGTEIRRARIYLQGKMYYDWGYKLQYDFASTGSNGKGIADAYISYNGVDNVQFKVGNFKDPFSLEQQTSSKYVMFNERSLTSAFSAGRHIGAMVSTKQQHWSLAAGLFGDALTKKGGADDEGWGMATRATFAPINDHGQLIHFGVALNYRDSGSASTIRFKQTPESHIAGINIVDTGNIDASDQLKIGFEAATVWGPFSAQAEYITTSVNRSVGSDLDFDGWYIQTGYLLTGESRSYKKGAFGSIKPNKSVGHGGIGAWELALRYSTLDLSDADIDGGEVDAVSLGLNWYATPTLRFSANYIDVLQVEGGLYNQQEPSVFQMRSQWAF